MKDHLGKHPRDVPSLVELGGALLARGKPQEALDALRKALELDPTSFRALEMLPGVEAGARKKQVLRPDGLK